MNTPREPKAPASTPLKVKGAKAPASRPEVPAQRGGNAASLAALATPGIAVSTGDVASSPLSQEALLRLWFEGDNLEKFGRDRSFGVPTFTVGEVTLFTRPCRVMDRPGPGLPYQEEDGVSYWFMDREKRLHWGFQDDKGGAQRMQATFEYFEKKYTPSLG